MPVIIRFKYARLRRYCSVVSLRLFRIPNVDSGLSSYSSSEFEFPTTPHANVLMMTYVLAVFSIV